MNIKAIGYIGALLAVLGFIGAEWFFARNYQRNVDLLARADTGQVVKLKPDTIKLPPDTIYTPGKVIHAPRPVLAPKTPIVDSLEAVIADLQDSVEAEITTSHGEMIRVTYDPKSENFAFRVEPLIIIQPERRDITRDLPEIPSPMTHFWAGMDLIWSGTPGVIGHIGYDQVGLSLGNVAEKPCWGVSVHLSL